MPEALTQCLEAQLQNGNWNYDPYMHGMANGLILAEAICAGTEPGYKSAPERWIADATPQPEGDGWIKCSERLPTEADADVDENVWVYDKAMSNEKYRQTRAIWWTVKEVSDYTHWKPTGLKPPQPPKEGE